ncbi:hypothetical protein E4U16_000604 [Claviceps sp. LM84 group G4]|nr:hypothetical protein E4U16_000604 [Claviceps sp. LM84 group G4]
MATEGMEHLQLVNGKDVMSVCSAGTTSTGSKAAFLTASNKYSIKEALHYGSACDHHSHSKAFEAAA